MSIFKCIRTTLNKDQLKQLKTNVPHHTETSQLICEGEHWSLIG